MRSLGGFILLAGIGVALFVYLPAPVDSADLRSAQLASAESAPVSRLGRFSPSIALSVPAARGPRLAGLEIAAAAALQAAIANDAYTGWQTTVVSARNTAPTVLTPRDPDARIKLAHDIQQQLRRVGCYWGRMDGSWDSVTRDAMKEFTNRVNATLPLDEPDYVQLALIQSQSNEVCGACPAGQSLSASGRCIGLPITAQTVVATQKQVLPWKANAAPGAAAALLLFKPVPTTVASTDPVPGRTGLGAPVPTSLDVQQDAPPVTPGSAAASPGTVMAALDPGVVKPPVTATPRAKHRSSSSDRRRAGRDHPRRFTGDYGRVGPGTPRHNLLLSLGGLY
jgi:hypothetical protein